MAISLYRQLYGLTKRDLPPRFWKKCTVQRFMHGDCLAVGGSTLEDEVAKRKVAGEGEVDTGRGTQPKRDRQMVRDVALEVHS